MFKKLCFLRGYHFPYLIGFDHVTLFTWLTIQRNSIQRKNGNRLPLEVDMQKHSLSKFIKNILTNSSPKPFQIK